MADSNTQKKELRDASLSVIHALSVLDVKALSYVQLRRLNAALSDAAQAVARETSARSNTGNCDDGDDTVRVSSPRFDHPR